MDYMVISLIRSELTNGLSPWYFSLVELFIK